MKPTSHQRGLRQYWRSSSISSIWHNQWSFDSSDPLTSCLTILLVVTDHTTIAGQSNIRRITCLRGRTKSKTPKNMSKILLSTSRKIVLNQNILIWSLTSSCQAKLVAPKGYHDQGRAHGIQGQNRTLSIGR